MSTPFNVEKIRQAIDPKPFPWMNVRAARAALAKHSTLLTRWLLMSFSLLCVLKTGWVHSPLLWLLYLPVLHAAIHGRATLGLGIGLVITSFYAGAIIAESDEHVAPDLAAIGVALSFPAVSIFATVFSQRHQDRIGRLHDRTDELNSLLDMSQMMDSAVDLDMTLNLILLNIQQITDCHLCAVYLMDDSGAQLDLKAASGPRDYLAFEPSIRVAYARHGNWSIDDAGTGRPATAYYVRDSAPVRERHWLFELVPEARSFICIPLAGVEGLLGMLYVGYNVPYGLGKIPLERLENLAARAVFPLHRALVQHGFESMAFSDVKTGLDNFRRFEQCLAEEWIRSERYNHDLSVILLDVDHFKRFNDQWGHPAGDALLGQLAAVLRRSLRNVDKLARYGGEEFVIICPETGKSGTRLISERIRRNVAENTFAIPGADGDEEVHVTVSLGYAAYPLDAESADELVSKADAALYQAKASGRNATCPAGGSPMPAQPVG